MTIDDLNWIRKLLTEKKLEEPALELGVGYGGATCRELIESAGLRYFGTDLEKTPAVDFVADFERIEDMGVFSSTAPFGCILVLNVLEHTFDPLRVLDNAVSLLKPGGRCAVVTPSIWPLHNYPMDTWRILPNLYEEYARRNRLILDRGSFEYVGKGAVEQFRDSSGNYKYPPQCGSAARLLWSRVVHKLFHTSGKGMFFPSNVAVAALLQKPAA
jgi:SAM-dependent methyltransferase